MTANGGDMNAELRESNRLAKRMRIVLLVLSVTTMLAVAAMILSIAGLVQRTNEIQVQRYEQAKDACQVVRLLYQEGGFINSLHESEAQYLKTSPLRDCTAYARHVVGVVFK